MKHGLGPVNQAQSYDHQHSSAPETMSGPVHPYDFWLVQHYAALNATNPASTKSPRTSLKYLAYESPDRARVSRGVCLSVSAPECPKSLRPHALQKLGTDFFSFFFFSLSDSGVQQGRPARRGRALPWQRCSQVHAATSHRILAAWPRGASTQASKPH